MIKIELQREFERLFISTLLTDKKASYQNVMDTAFKIIDTHQHKEYKDDMDNDPNLLFQMILLKALAINKLIEGINYENPIAKDAKFTGMVDPFSIWVLVRSQFEAFCVFNNIYMNSKSEDERIIKHALWALSGLNYRQRFTPMAHSEENIVKARTEKEVIQELKSMILQNKFYASLSPQNQNKIQNAIKSKAYQIHYQGGEISKASWQELIQNAGCNHLFDEMYNHLSLNTHPSKVSVFQFKNIFNDGHNIFSSYVALEVSKNLIAFMIRDYCEYFKEIKLVFNGLPDVNQLLINMINVGMRSKEYMLNDIEFFF